MISEQYRDKLTRVLTVQELLNSTKEAIEQTLVTQGERLKHLEEAQAFLQVQAKETQEQIKFSLEDIVNLALDAVFPGKYKFVMVFEIKRGKTEVRLTLNKDGNEFDPLTENGGGVTAVLELALRIALLLISKNRRVLILDEPLHFVSLDKKPIAIEILKRLSADMGIQIIAVSHDPLFIDSADRVYRVTQTDGVSTVKEE